MKRTAVILFSLLLSSAAFAGGPEAQKDLTEAKASVAKAEEHIKAAQNALPPKTMQGHGDAALKALAAAHAAIAASEKAVAEHEKKAAPPVKK